jgi:hypothetical protein
MLSIGKLAAGPEAGRYYEEAVAQGREDYYAGEGEAPGRWLGGGPQRLGLAGEVNEGEVGRLLAGEHPDSGGLLGAAMGEGSVAGLDLTFKAPKSVSIVFWDRRPRDRRTAARLPRSCDLRCAGLSGARGVPGQAGHGRRAGRRGRRVPRRGV